MDNKKLISVIVPCYNVEKYIDRCLTSLVNQTLGIDNLEIICINDASTDLTLEKLEEWERRYPDSIMVVTYDINQKQGGARNIGMDYASADYIGFIDSDDWIDSGMYKDLYNKAVSGDYDKVVCKFIHDFGNDTSDLPAPQVQKDQEYCFSKNGGYYFAEPDVLGVNGNYGSICTAIFRRSIIADNELYFPLGIAYEDNYWHAFVRLYIHKLYIIDRVYYHYFFNANSTVTTRNSIHHLDRLPVEIGILEEYKHLGIFETYYYMLMGDFIERYYLNTMFIIFTRFDKYPNIYRELRDNVYSYFPNWEEVYPVQLQKKCNVLLLDFLKKNEIASDMQLKRLGEAFLDESGFRKKT